MEYQVLEYKVTYFDNRIRMFKEHEVNPIWHFDSECDEVLLDLELLATRYYQEYIARVV